MLIRLVLIGAEASPLATPSLRRPPKRGIRLKASGAGSWQAARHPSSQAAEQQASSSQQQHWHKYYDSLMNGTFRLALPSLRGCHPESPEVPPTYDFSGARTLRAQTPHAAVNCYKELYNHNNICKPKTLYNY